MSSKGSAPQKRVVTFDSDDSSASDAEEGTRGGDALAREMAAAAERERRKNPHGETGRAKAPRSHRVPQTGTAVSAPYKAKTMDLFSSDSSSSSSDEAETTEGDKAKAGGSREGQPTAVPPPSGSKVAHVQGLSFRAVKAGGQPASAAEDSSSPSGSDDEEKDEALHINKAFATRYEEQKRKQELHTLAEKYKKKLGRVAAAVTKTTGKSGSGSDDDDDDYVGASEDEEDDAEEDDDAVLLTRENNLNFAKALLAVRKATVPLSTSSSADATAGGGATAGPLLPKEELLKGRFFPPAEEQMKVNTEIFEHYVDHKRHHKGDGAAFTLSDEYARALHATAQSEDAVVDSAEGRERDGLRKLRPQTAEEAKLRAAFLKSVEGSADTFEVVRGSKSNEAEKAGDEMDDGDSAEAEERRLAAAREEEMRLLEEAFSLGKRSAAARKKAAQQGSEEAADDDGDDPDSFLRDFFVQELWRPGSSAAKRKKGRAEHAEATDDNDDGEDDEEDGNANGGSYYDRLAQLAREEEDEAFFNDAEVWEREYQEKKYRHQEAEEEAALSGGAVAAHVQTFPRPIGEAATGLLRKPDTARKDARQRRRERAEAAHAQQVEELKRLKHLKRKEIEDQRALIASVAGLTVGKKRVGGSSGQSPFAGADADEEAELARLKAVWSDKDLDAPFDPAEFDKKMAQLFNEDYYDEKNVDEDEIAFFDEELDKADGGEGDEDPNDDDDLAAIKAGAAPALFAADSLEAAQAMLPAKAKKSKKNKKQDSGEKFFDDVFGPQHGDHKGTEADDGTSDALALLYPSEALQALEKDRQQLNELMAAAKTGSGSASESNEELLERLRASLKKKEEEYYQLHRNAAAEGAGGGLPFRYREVEPEDFTLSIEEILALDDRQLNMIAPINCYAAYLDKESNERDRRRIERRRQKGFREIASDRSSRRYGDVKSTALLNPEQINDEEGAAIAEKLSKRLREEGEDPDAPLEKAPRQQQFHGRGGRGGAAFRGAHRGSDYGRGRGGGRGASGGPRGRGGPAAPFRGRGGGSDAFGAAQRGGRGGPRGRGGFRGRGA